MTKIDKKCNSFNHEFKKSLGQNFISDTNLLSSLVSDSGISERDFVIEIGAGAGTLTKIIAKKSKFVLSYEIDESLFSRLNELEKGIDNLKFSIMDILKVDAKILRKSLAEAYRAKTNNEIDEQSIKYKVVANIPYYITSPILFKLFEDASSISSINLMVQKEVAERIIAKSGSEYGILSLAVSYFGTAKIKRIVGKQNFYPMPKVDSAFVQIDLETGKNSADNFESFMEVVKASFNYRRKTILNNLSVYYHLGKEETTRILRKLEIDVNRRAETISLDEYILLMQELPQRRKNLVTKEDK